MSKSIGKSAQQSANTAAEWIEGAQRKAHTKTLSNIGSTVLDLAYPPSTNRLWRSAHGKHYVSPEAETWKRQAGWIARMAKCTLATGNVAVAITLHPRQTKRGEASKTRLDLDNTIKCTLDALNGIAWHDDKQVTCLVAVVGDPKPGGGLTVELSQARNGGL